MQSSIYPHFPLPCQYSLRAHIYIQNVRRKKNRYVLIDLSVREPLARLEILLLKRGTENAQTPHFAGRRRVVALDVGFGLAVGGLEGESAGGLCEREEKRVLAGDVCVMVVCFFYMFNERDKGKEGKGKGQQRTSFLWCRHS